MHPARRSFAHVLIACLLLAMAIGPGSQAQGAGSNYCPPGDQGDQAPPGVNPTKPHVDLAVQSVRLHMEGRLVGERGAYLIARTSGTADVTVAVKNEGTAESTEVSKLQLSLARPGANTLVRTLELDVPAPGATTPLTTTYELAPGRYTLTLAVNPGESPAERCTDSLANPNCGGLTEPCTTTYYDNNVHVVGIIAGGLPVLAVENVSAAGPVRATSGPSPESEARVDVRVANAGVTLAHNLDAVAVGALPFHVRIEVVGCKCDAQLRNVTSLAPGEARTVSASFPLHGLKEAFQVKVRIDPDRKTADLDRPLVDGGGTFPLPTADLQAGVETDHPREGHSILVPVGEGLRFDVVVTNGGDAPAQTTSGGGFLVTVHRGNNDNLVHEERVTVDAMASRSIPVTDPAGNLTGVHVYRIRVDPADEVVETSRSRNTLDVRVAVARYEFLVDLAPAALAGTVPPGIDARLPFTLENTGTVSDTYELSLALEDRSAQRYETDAGETVTEVRLGPRGTFDGALVRTIPRAAADGDEVPTAIRVRSTTTNDLVVANVTYRIGPDDHPPTIEIVHPTAGFLGTDNRLVLRVRDNVALRSVAADLTGSLQPLVPDAPGGDAFTLDATGLPNSFSFRVRATDAAGNTAEETFEITRDNTPPRIASVAFTPAPQQGGRGVLPGQNVLVQIEARDTNMDRVQIHIEQPRPDGMYQENITLRGAGPNYFLRDWIVPERPGHYVFKVTVYDKAGNTASRTEVLYVQGLNIRIATAQPLVRPASPQEGEPVLLSYVIENTSPQFETGPFLVTLVVDFQLQVGVQRVELGPSERRQITFAWPATEGPHAFAFVLDQAEEVAEDCEGEACNVHVTSTNVLFPDHPLFDPGTVRRTGFDTFGERIAKFWFIPLLFLGSIALFLVATRLARREEEP